MKIIIFAPHSLLWKHAFPEALVAEALQQKGHKVLYLTCGEIFNHFCISMFSSKMSCTAPTVKKAAICARCTRNARILLEEFRFPGFELADFFNEQDRAETERILSQVDRGNFRSTELDGIKVGRLALYQVLLRYKKITFDFSDKEWSEYLADLKSTVIATVILRKVFAREKPDRVIVYNALYSVNAVCRDMAIRLGAIPYFLHAGGGLTNRLQTLVMGKGHAFDFYASLVANWNRFKDIPVSQALMRSATDHFIQLLIAKSPYAYSAKRSLEGMDIRRHFEIGVDRKILVATIASYDEEKAAMEVGARDQFQSLLFPTQVEWLRFVINWINARSDLFLIIRVHPREMPNKRESVISEHSDSLKALLTSLPENVTVNWPDQGVSLYDLVEETNVFLNSWSSTGKEMPMLGRPVVTYGDCLIAFPPELNYTAATPQAYLNQIDNALSDDWNPERIRLTYRWLAIEYSRALIDISDSYSENDSSHRKSFSRRVLDKMGRVIDPDLIQRRDCQRRAPSLAAADIIHRMVESGAETPLDLLDPSTDRVDLTTETMALRQEIGRLMPFLYRGRQQAKPGSLHAHLAGFVAGRNQSHA